MFEGAHANVHPPSMLRPDSSSVDPAWLLLRSTPSQFLPPCYRFGENRLHDSFPSEVHGGRGLALRSLLSSWGRISWAGQRRDQVHLGYRKRLHESGPKRGSSLVTVTSLKSLNHEGGASPHFAVRLLGFLVLESPAAFSTSPSSEATSS